MKLRDALIALAGFLYFDVTSGVVFYDCGHVLSVDVRLKSSILCYVVV